MTKKQKQLFNRFAKLLKDNKIRFWCDTSLIIDGDDNTQVELERLSTYDNFDVIGIYQTRPQETKAYRSK